MDLSESTFFDERTLSFLSRLLSSEKTISTINAYENFLLEKREDLLKLNKDMNYSLVRTLNQYKDFVPVNDGIRFLAACNSRGKLPEGLRVLDGALYDKKLMNFKALKESFDNMGNMPEVLAAAIFGEASEGRHSKEKDLNLHNSNIDLNLLKDFK